MAKQTIGIGTTANDGTGDTLRAAFDKTNDNFDEVYAKPDISYDNSTSVLTLTRADGSTDTADLSILLDDTNLVDSVDGSGGLESDTTTGDVTISISDDGVTHDKLEARYTAQAAISTLTGTVSFDCSTASSFKLSGDLTGAYTIDLSNYKKGQVVTIYPLKAQSVTLDAQGSSTNTFNKIGGVDYDNTTSSILQIECVDDSSTDPVFFYSIATFASDSTI